MSTLIFSHDTEPIKEDDHELVAGEMNTKTILVSFALALVTAQAAQPVDQLEDKLKSLEAANAVFKKIQFGDKEKFEALATQYSDPTSPQYDKHVSDVFELLRSMGIDRPASLTTAYMLEQEIEKTKKQLQERSQKPKNDSNDPVGSETAEPVTEPSAVQDDSAKSNESQNAKEQPQNAKSSNFTPEISGNKTDSDGETHENELQIQENIHSDESDTQKEAYVQPKDENKSATDSQSSSILNAKSHVICNSFPKGNDSSGSKDVMASKSSNQSSSAGKTSGDDSVPFYQNPLIIGGVVVLLVAIAVTVFLVIRKKKSDDEKL